VSSSQGTIESVFLQGEAGRLEALVNHGAEDARFACLVCHPHPVFGGTMHNKVVYQAMKELNSFGFPVLRFNFRGVEASAGTYDDGRGEVADARVALDYLSARFGLPLFAGGFSFGAAMAMEAGVAHAGVRGLILLGAPFFAGDRQYSYEPLRHSTLPKLLISGGRDRFTTPAQLQQIFDEAAEPKQLVVLPESDHFFTKLTKPMREAIHAWVREQLEPAAAAAV
jgi:alpha/beta superfamily hydrolase